MKSNRLLKLISSFALSIALMLSLVVPAFAATSTNSTTTIKLMAAASMRYTLGERDANGAYPDNSLLRAFEDQNVNTKVNVTYDSSGNLLNQMKADTNKSTDIFISADLARMNSAVTEGIIDVSTVYNLLNNKLVLVGNKSAGLTENSLTYADVLDWLDFDSIRKIAIGDPAVVPAGTYTKKVFDALGSTTWDNILTHATLKTNVTDVLNTVADADKVKIPMVGSVYATDAKTKPGLIVLATEDVNIIYPIGITNAAMTDTIVRKPAAEALVKLLKDDIAKASGSIFKNAGFSPAK